MKLKKGEFIVSATESYHRLSSGDGSLYHFLRIPHKAIFVGNQVLIDMLYPAKLSQKNVIENTKWLLNVVRLKRYESGGKYSDAPLYRNIHLHVNGKGEVTFLSVPREWMKIDETG